MDQVLSHRLIRSAPSTDFGKGSVAKSGITIAKTDFLGNPNFWAHSLLNSLTCSSHDRAMLCKEKNFPNKHQSFSNFWVFILLKKTDFWPKRISAKRKNSRFSVIPAGTSYVVIVGHLLVARTVPPSCVDYASKLRVLILAIGHWPEMAKNGASPGK